MAPKSAIGLKGLICELRIDCCTEIMYTCICSCCCVCRMVDSLQSFYGIVDSSVCVCFCNF